nr:DUF87 domain-containing protein [uncultured Draconibacterium sp.]
MQNEEQKYQYTNSFIFDWEYQSEEEKLVLGEKKCTEFITGFKILSIPEFNELQMYNAEEHYYNTLLRQKTFLDSIYNVFVKAAKGLSAYIELRIQNNPEIKTIDTFMILRIVRTGNIRPNLSRIKKQFEEVIPDEYEFVVLNETELKNVLNLEGKSIVEIQKTRNLLSVGSFYHEDSLGIPPRNLVEWDKTANYHIPCTSYIEPKRYNFSNFYKLLQNANEKVQLRISVGSIDVYNFEKNLAVKYLNMLKITYIDMLTPELNNYIEAYSKYINTNHLLSIKMQVSASIENTARAFANAFCSQITYGEVKNVTSFHCFSLNDTPLEILKGDWESCNHYYHVNPEVEIPFKDHEELIDSFIQRMPYISDTSEAMAVFRLPIAQASGIPGMISKSIKPFYQPNPKSKQETNNIELGKVVVSNKVNNELEYSLPLKDLTKHGLIVGATGSGKTNTTLNFVKELIRNDIPFLIIEPVKSEYYEKVSKLLQEKGKRLKRFQLSTPFKQDGKANKDFLRFNPFVAIQGITPFQHLSYIKSCLMAAFPMFGIMPAVLEDCLYEYLGQDYKVKGKDGQSVVVYKGLCKNDFFNISKNTKHHLKVNGKIINNRYKTLKGFSQFVEKYLNENKKQFNDKSSAELVASLSRRLSKLTKGLLGQIFCPENWSDSGHNYSNIDNNIDVVLNQPCIVELEALPDNDDKALVMAFLLTYLFESRQLRKSHSKENQLHVTLIEEAHRLLSSSSSKSSGGGENANMSQDSGTKTINLFIDMLAEIRAKNESIFIVEQSPTKLIADAIKNTNLKIMHRITNKSDRDYLGEAMNMDEQQSRYATTLEQGEALVFDEQLNKPILVKMNEFDKKE